MENKMNYNQFLFYQLYTVKNPNFIKLEYDIQYNLILKESAKYKEILNGNGNLYEEICEALEL